MFRSSLTLSLVVATVLGGCEPAADPAASNSATSGTQASVVKAREPGPVEVSPRPAAPPMVSPVGGVNDGSPDLTPPRLAPEAERGVKGARSLLLSWARAIELEEFDQAWAMMGEAGRGQWSKAEFAEIFAGLGDITVAVPDGEMEGAAGSSYYSSQATITATDADGRPVRIESPLFLRRVNDVPGASAEQLRWHFDRVRIDWTH